jgi:hypothetical protein
MGVDFDRRTRLWTGLLLAAGPWILLFPGLAFVSICPPQGAAYISTAMYAAFILSEVVAAGKLMAVVNTESDWISRVGVAGLFISGTFILLFVVLVFYSLVKFAATH